MAETGAKFVLIGGHAVSAHGYERATTDVDIVYSTALEHCTRMVHALGEIDATVTMADTPPPAGSITPEWLAAGGHFMFHTECGPLHALSWVSGLDYADLDSRAQTAELADGTLVRVCSYGDLVTMKRQAGRPRDRVDLRELEAVREEQDIP
ncbi:MAG: hypothetical protein M3355_04340 [Actinomycetota bacterium]|nr:hypothetical protein [Actinomycetota bacterium]